MGSEQDSNRDMMADDGARDSSVSVRIGPFRVIDLPRAEIVRRLAVGTPHVAFHLHVGALLHRDDPEFVRAVDDADFAYADGMAIVWLARLAGARQIERTPMTDIGHDVLEGLARQLARRVRVALVGGPRGLATRAGEQLQHHHGVEVVCVSDGFQPDFGEFLGHLGRTRPDVVFVGMGIPREATWVAQHRTQLANTLVMTCGGWFGHIVGLERRAPRWAQHLGLEWLWRAAQQPRRLVPRYARGSVIFAGFALRLLARRIVPSRTRAGGRG